MTINKIERLINKITGQNVVVRIYKDVVTNSGNIVNVSVRLELEQIEKGEVYIIGLVKKIKSLFKKLPIQYKSISVTFEIKETGDTKRRLDKVKEKLMEFIVKKYKTTDFELELTNTSFNHTTKTINAGFDVYSTSENFTEAVFPADVLNEFNIDYNPDGYIDVEYIIKE